MAPLGPLQQATAIMLHHHHQHLNHASSNVNNHYELNHHHRLKTNKQDHNHHHHLDLTSANNFLMSGQQHAQNTLNHHGRSSDQYGSLNLSSVGSSVSSAHHSPIMERHLSETTHQQQNGNNQNQNHNHNHNNNNNNNKKREPDEHERAFGQLTISTEMNHRHHHNMTPNHQLLPTCSLTSSSEATSDYIGSLPCSPASPIESSIGSPPKLSAEVELLLNSGGASPDERSPSCSPTCSTAGGHHLLVSALAPCYHTSLNYHHSHNHLHQQTPTEQSSSTVSSNTNLNSNSNSNNNHLLRPLGHQHQQQAKKVRSFSHSTSFSPLVNASSNNNQQKESQDKWSGSETRERGRLSSTSSRQSPASCEELNQPKVIERPRRLSRIENRQSLHDLGYGRQESYFKLQRLGKGTYATVYMGRSRVNNDLVALKEILKEHDEGAPCTAIREVSLLRLLRHNNIVTLHDICHTPNKLTLVFEYVGPDLYAYMKENNHLLSIHNVRLLLYQLLRGISFCHSRQVLHRDLKPQNLLINSRGELKICDFGLARAKSIPTKSYSNEVVTLWYRPPDVLLGNTDYDHSIDMWGVGCIFYELASGRTFFPGSSVRQQLYLIFSSLGAPSPRNWPEILSNAEYLSYSFPAFRPEKLGHKVPRLDHEGVQLLQSFLRFKPSERISAETARRSSFFAGLPERVHHLHERESIFDVAGVCMSLNPGQKLSRHHRH